jgi:hypothetical protein
MSPIDQLYQHLIPALVNVAPERAAELQQLLDKHHITFVFDDKSPDMIFFACARDKTITMGLRALERLWAQAFAYISLYEFITKKHLADPTVRDYDLTGPEIKPAMDLLKWAFDVERRLRDKNPGDISWPDGLPRPNKDAGKDSLEKAADELFLCAIGSVLHHEVGHIERNHDPRSLFQPSSALKPEDAPDFKMATAIRLEWEKEADAWSANWLLDGIDESDDRFLKRVLGISLGFLWEASRNVYTGRWLSRHHPPAWDRLYQNVKQHVSNNPHHPIWPFVAYVLQLHLMSIEIQPSITETEDHEAWVNQLLNHISKSTD